MVGFAKEVKKERGWKGVLKRAVLSSSIKYKDETNENDEWEQGEFFDTVAVDC